MSIACCCAAICPKAKSAWSWVKIGNSKNGFKSFSLCVTTIPSRSTSNKNAKKRDSKWPCNFCSNKFNFNYSKSTHVISHFPKIGFRVFLQLTPTPDQICITSSDFLFHIDPTKRKTIIYVKIYIILIVKVAI